MRYISDGHFDANFQIKESEVVLEDERSLFGALRSGCLEVEGCLQPVFLVPQEQKIIPTSENAPNEVSTTWYQLDRHEVERLPGNGGLVCLYLLLVEVRRLHVHYEEYIIEIGGLALSQSHNGLYSRQGLFGHHSGVLKKGDCGAVLRWFHSLKPQKLKVV